ncbi:heparan-alpha-glucosaminide N-acetyltransferase domain-containing protein [Sinomonas sp.]|uniref:heparan-alpha-glucosaminide N-acetyltransferase domain-containing protein n=1 Tax=Sinomonas sp. TaxID=1914986 RepID=UPI002FE2EF91
MSARRPASRTAGTAVHGRALAHGRLLGVDLARGAALLALMAVHLLPIMQPGPAGQPEPTWAGLVFSGRTSALFGVLAGVSLSLGVPAAERRLGLALRGGVIAAVGLCLGTLHVGIAVVLVQFGALFCCVIPALRLRQRALGLLASTWILLAPIAAYLARPWLMVNGHPVQLGHNPTWPDLADPARLAADVFVNGSLPVLECFAYLLVGLWLGRLPLRRADLQAGLVLGGAAAAVLAKAAEWALMVPLGGRAALLATPQASQWPLEAMLRVNLLGVQQTGSVWWLATAAPHSGTTLDLLHTSGTSAAVLGAFLLIARVRPLERTGILLPLAGAGGMTLTLYTLHVWAVSWSEAGGTPALEQAGLLAVHVVVVLAVGLLFRANGWRGPLEWVTHGAYRLGARTRRPGIGQGSPRLSAQRQGPP